MKRKSKPQGRDNRLQCALMSAHFLVTFHHNVRVAPPCPSTASTSVIALPRSIFFSSLQYWLSYSQYPPVLLNSPLRSVYASSANQSLPHRHSTIPISVPPKESIQQIPHPIQDPSGDGGPDPVLELPPKPTEPDNCCMSGCTHCVWDIYMDDLERWKKAVTNGMSSSEESKNLP